MYEKFYGLSENPFSITSDPSFFFFSKHHAEAFSHLKYGIEERKGIILITGEIGTGKTTLCRALLDSIDKKTKTALVLYPIFSELQLLKTIIKDFGISSKNQTKAELINALNNYLIDETSRGHNVALIIDESQNLKISQLEQIRLLSNLETDKHKLLQIILVGQPELCSKLSLPALRQINQRIAVRYHIHPLKKEELKKYISHRLQISGENGKIMFSHCALEQIFDYTKGTPRLINILCDRALLAGFVHNTFHIHSDIIKQCIHENNDQRTTP